VTATVIFVANGFTRDNVRLQPWRYIYELARYQALKNKVIVVTEGASDVSVDLWDEGFSVVETCFLGVKQQAALGDYILSLNPDELWWSTTTRSIAFYPLLSRIHCRKIAYITCPLYKWAELIRASLSGVPYEQSRSLWGQRLVPWFLFRWFLNSRLFDGITVQSKNNQAVLEKGGISSSRIHFLPVGIDEEDIKPVDNLTLEEVANTLKKKGKEVIFLYLGALRPIRGFDSLIKAFPNVVKNNPRARLVVLARGASDERCEVLREELVAKGLGDCVSIVGGWLKREQVWSYIELSDLVVLPFVLVPSDIPIAVLESLARGKPVVVSPVDGLPELAMERGIVVDPLDTRKFSNELLQLSEDQQRIERYTESAREFINTYPRWSDVGRIMDDISSHCERGNP